MKANSTQEAWGIVNQIFPTDYEKDEDSSQRAGYSIYRSTADGRYYDYICDLGNRLEINLEDGNKAINVWIEAKAEPDNNKESVEAMHSAKELGKTISTLFGLENCIKITFSVNGCKFEADETERKVYAGLKRGESWLAHDIISSYCDNHGIRWAIIEGLHIAHYEHNNGKDDGHFVITAYIRLQQDMN